MKKLSILILGISLFTACSSSETKFSDKPNKDILVEISDSEVVKLNGKDIHISFLDNQIANMAADFELTSEVRVHQNAPFHVVQDAQASLRRYSSGIAYIAVSNP
jgi:biopolymer transport protein ExbD